MASRSEKFTEIIEFFETFSLVLDECKIPIKQIEKYIYQRRGNNELQDIYHWIFTTFMKPCQCILNYLKRTSDEMRVSDSILRTPEYSNFYHDQAEVKKLWKQRPWQD